MIHRPLHWRNFWRHPRFWRHLIGWVLVYFFIFEFYWELPSDRTHSESSYEMTITENILSSLAFVGFVYLSYYGYHKWYKRGHIAMFYVYNLLAMSLYITIYYNIFKQKYDSVDWDDLFVEISIGFPLMIFGFYAVRYLYHVTVGLLQYQNLKRQKVQAEIKLQKSKINSHFLFNMLNTIYAYNMYDGEKADELILDLADHLRYQLYANKTDEISLAQEIETLQRFIEMEKVRHSQVEVSFDVSGEIQNRYIAPMILLPIIENAFIDGDTQAGIFININIQVDADNHLHFDCTHQRANQRTTSKSKLLPLAARDNLNTHYPKQHDIKINQQNTQVTISIELPLKIKDKLAHVA